MGNVLEVIEKELESSAEEEQLSTVDEDEFENVIDLDSDEYKRWLQAKREKEGRTQDDEKFRLIRIDSHTYRVKPMSEQPREPIPAQVLLPKNNSEGFNKRSDDSERRIAEMRKKYSLKNRDYKRRGSVVLIMDDKRALAREREERQKLRQQIRSKYQLPAPRARARVMAG